MSEPEAAGEPDAVLRAQLRVFCRLMLGSTHAADCVVQQVYRRALDHADEPGGPAPERVALFRIAADLCGVHRQCPDRCD
jgi:DNA-directed RNA polymerase specialized sigma24 family protein